MIRSNIVQIKRKPVFPPPDWPGCPGTLRYRTAVKLMTQAQNSCSSHPTIQLPPSIRRRTYADARILQGIHQEEAALTETLAKTNGYNPDMDFEQVINILDAISNDAIIPFTIILEPDNESTVFLTSILSRHPKWMGAMGALPALRGAHAILYTYDGYTPHAFIAVQPHRITSKIDNLPTAPPALRLPNTTQGKTINRILRHHGATPHYLHIDQELYPSQALENAVDFQDYQSTCDHEGPCLPPLHTGTPWDWRN